MLFEKAREIEFIAELQFKCSFADRHIGAGEQAGRTRDQQAVEKMFRGEPGVIDEFLDELGKILRENRIHINRCFKYQDAGRIQLIREFGTLISEEYTQDGIEVEAYVPKEIYDKL